MSALEPGIHAGVDPTRYHRDELTPRPALSSTLGRLLLDRSPKHAWTAHPQLNPDWQPNDRKTFDIGRAAHRELLGAGGDYAEIPDELLASNGAASTKEAKAFIAECRGEGVTPIKAEEAETVRVMAKVARERLAEMKIEIDPALSELVALAEIDGCPVRALVDNAPAARSWLIDFKTCEDASADACIRAVVGYGYDFQAGHYLDTWEAATGERRKMVFVFQEKSPPYEIGVVELHDDPDSDADWMLDARHKCAEARRIWAECTATGVWPGYPPRIAVVGAPTYHRQRWAYRPVQAPVPQSAIARATAWQGPAGAAA